MKTFAVILTIVYFLSACSGEGEVDPYTRLVRKELATNKRVDSIFFGIHLGMVNKDFYRHCWKMNKKGVFRDGTGNNYVLYPLDKELKYPASMNFYPDFNDSTIWRMRVIYEYDGWGPWAKHLSADSLLPDVLSLYKKWYTRGNEFMAVTDKSGKPLYVKVDGNRKIIIRKNDDVVVSVEFTDILVEKARAKNGI